MATTVAQCGFAYPPPRPASDRADDLFRDERRGPKGAAFGVPRPTAAPGHAAQAEERTKHGKQNMADSAHPCRAMRETPLAHDTQPSISWRRNPSQPG